MDKDPENKNVDGARAASANSSSFSAMAIATPAEDPKDEGSPMDGAVPNKEVTMADAPAAAVEGDAEPMEEAPTACSDTGAVTGSDRGSAPPRATPPRRPTSPSAGEAKAPARKAPTAPGNPLRKLSVNLLATYKNINDVYYARKRRQQEQQLSSAKKKPEGCDDENGDYKIRVGDVLNERYEIREPKPLGKGSFGVVVKAWDSKAEEYVALKIIKNEHRFLEQAQVEKKFLHQFMEYGEVVLDACNIVCLKNSFIWKQHQCLVFELLNLSLYDLLKRTRHQGVSLNLVRKFAKQVLATLQFLGHPEVGIVHCDLKPENILLRNGISCQIKVIDFGSSCNLDRQMYTYIQSRFYRSPEVLLGLPYGHAIDMWSLGCIMIEMHTGHPIFNGRDAREQMQKICEYKGFPPEHMLAKMSSRSRIAPLFSKSDSGARTLMVRGQPMEVPRPDKTFRQTIGVDTGGPGGRRKGERGHNVRVYEMFLDLVTLMLEYDPALRITPQQAARHPFFTESDLFGDNPAPAAKVLRTQSKDSAAQTDHD